MSEEGGLAGRLSQYLSGCNPTAKSIMYASIEDLFERATHGELYLRAPGGSGGEVVVMGARREVLELVVGKQYLADGQKYHLRVYFTEPLDEPGILLALNVAWKRDYPMGKVEQDAHVEQAFDRFVNRVTP